MEEEQATSRFFFWRMGNGLVLYWLLVIQGIMANTNMVNGEPTALVQCEFTVALWNHMLLCDSSRLQISPCSRILFAECTSLRILEGLRSEHLPTPG